MAQNTALFLLIVVSFLAVAVHSAGIFPTLNLSTLPSFPRPRQIPDDSSPPKNRIPDAVHHLLEKVSENLQDVLKRVLALLGNPTTLPANLVGVLHDVGKILGDVIEALGRILGFAG